MKDHYNGKHAFEEAEIGILLVRYFSGELDKSGAEALEQWIHSDEEHVRLANEVCRICSMGETLHVMKTTDTEAALKKMHRRMFGRGLVRVSRHVARFAAVLFLPAAILCGWYAWKYYNPSPDEYIEMRTATGMLSSVMLPDSSKVWLNSNSILRYPVRFTGKKRTVSLKGEAYFDVKRDEERRFIVETPSMQVEVLGTEFNVDAYDEPGRDARTALVEGSVQMSFSDSAGVSHVVRMSPGQLVTYCRETDEVTRSRINMETITSWKNGSIVFDNTSLADALRMVENRYNVSFDIRNRSLLKNRYTGRFDNQSLDRVLEYFVRTTDIRFEREDPVSANVSGREKIRVY